MLYFVIIVHQLPEGHCPQATAKLKPDLILLWCPQMAARKITCDSTLNKIVISLSHFIS